MAKQDDLDDEQDGQDEAKAYASWDGFWAEVQREEEAERGGPATEVIRGVTVAVPHDLPLRFDRRAEQRRRSSSEEDMKQLLADLFGVDVLDAWVEAGMTHDEIQVVLMWGYANGKGKPTSFREAYELVREMESGKAKSSTQKSGGGGGSGGRSKRTSAPGTASGRKNSRT
ncbi:hypothetical protein IMZ11_33690 [Microtetraspora sp. AC03309]|uniref:hypothetical protein n=1 Tax=Microtetraspora sp. AC03309 TaxID=2779376 RepID=UPI001E631670|nr:hypothetical protein [Microtetraspora sp. AC03309]MCC5580582.1 hypothetical protein [Microtetraspora sp. AC03309]